jgi:hypothetical protein
MTELYDRELGAALRDLQVPEHRAGFDQELERLLAAPRRPSRRMWALAAAAALAVVAAALAVLVLPHGSEVASAAEVRSAVTAGFASAGMVSGVFVNRERPNAQNRWRFVLDRSGSFRITGLGPNNPTDLAYDSDANVETWSDLGIFTRRVGLAPGPPDAAPAAWVVQRGLGSVVAALVAAPDAEVEEITYSSRPAWLLRTPTGNPGEERLITVDRASGIPVRDQRLRNGGFAGEWRIDELEVRAEPARTVFRLQASSKQQQTTYDMGFRRIDLADVRQFVGYRPLVPTWVPDGYRLAEVSVARSSRPTGGEEHQNPESRNVVSLRYDRGLDRLVVTTRLTGSNRTAWDDPVVGSSVRTNEPQRVTFGGRDGRLVIDPNSVPHVWAVAGPLVVTIAGNVDDEELLRIAESLPS